MPLIDAILPHAAPFALALARVSGIFFFTPALSGPVVPVRIKALVVVALTLAVYPAIGAGMPGAPVDLITLAPMIVGELLVGAAIGLLVAIPVLAAQMGGLIIGQQMGLGLGVVFNPALNSDGDTVGQVLFFMALALFLALGGLDLAHGAVLESFNNVPLGALTAGAAPVDLLVGVLASGFDLALRVAAPVLVILMLETVSTGVLMKTVPQLNILTFGFPIKIIASALAIVGALPFISEAVRADALAAIDAVFLWVRSL
ncbi:MAG: type III secretion protein [Planctomycetota bacterium]|nr:MAG: type III secretion protein [Planctomycetota bacterium]